MRGGKRRTEKEQGLKEMRRGAIGLVRLNKAYYLSKLSTFREESCKGSLN